MDYTKEQLSEWCEDFFKGKVKPKHLTSFCELTPNENKIEGFINHKPNRYLGSMLIVRVNGEECMQFVQSMPKIHYYNDNRDIPSKDNVNVCYEKLDGSCLILYPLKNNTGEIIEIVPKTRGRAVADKHFISLYDNVDKKPILDYYKEHDGVLIFELYGVLNQHEIIHYNTGVDIRLIGVFEGKDFTNNPIEVCSYGFQLPDALFELYYEDREWVIQATSKKYYNYLRDEKTKEWRQWRYPTVDDAVIGLKDLLEELNNSFEKVNGRIATEGVVINTINKDGYKKWLKCKPTSIMNKVKSEYGIPRKDITKEVLKYFDEYGSRVKEIYLEDKNHHTEYLNRMLLEEYDEVALRKSKNKIERIFMQIWDSKEVPESLHKICDDLIVEYPSLSARELMPIFAREYPQKRKDARMVFSVLESKIAQRENSKKG